MQYNAPLHNKRKWISSHLAENLLLKYDKRSMPLVKGDTVKVMRGSFKGHEDKVAQIHVRKQLVEIEGITTVKSDGTKVAKPIYPSNVLITKLNLTDKWRRKKLERGLSEEAKKEIEKEAEEQLKELEEEEHAAELAEEEHIEEEEEPEKVPSEIPEKKPAPPKKEEKKKTVTKKPPKKKPPVKQKQKTTDQKKPVKKPIKKKQEKKP